MLSKMTLTVPTYLIMPFNVKKINIIFNCIASKQLYKLRTTIQDKQKNQYLLSVGQEKNEGNRYLMLINCLRKSSHTSKQSNKHTN
jgi:hypothetical protein